MATTAAISRSTEPAEDQPLGLIVAVADAFRQAEINYCLWKGTFRARQVAAGKKDIDILVTRTDETRLLEIITRLGFKPALAQYDLTPGVLDFFGLDADSGKLVHLHLHFTLVAGDRLTSNYLISLTDAYVAASRQGDLFRIPSPEFEYVVFVIRMILNTLGNNSLAAGRRKELEFLAGQMDEEKVLELLDRQFSFLSCGLFSDCAQALTNHTSWFNMGKLRRRLQHDLALFARRSSRQNLAVRFQRRMVRAWQTRIRRQPPLKRRLMHGGTTIAFIGGDGAGKSTAIAAMDQWLSADLEVMTVHLGKPHRTLRTKCIRGILKVLRGGTAVLKVARLVKTNQTSPLSEMFWQYCLAGDRARLYRQAKEFANRGGIVIFDRFPLPEIIAMDGPQIATMISEGHVSSFWKFLARKEQACYARMLKPDLMFVLRLQPEIAIQRKPSEDPEFVRQRGHSVWNADWWKCDAHVIDAAQPMDQVHTEIRNLIWTRV
jgi:thymidylate kinase